MEKKWNVKTTSGTIVVSAVSFIGATFAAEKMGYWVLSVEAAA